MGETVRRFSGSAPAMHSLGMGWIVVVTAFVVLGVVLWVMRHD